MRIAVRDETVRRRVALSVRPKAAFSLSLRKEVIQPHFPVRLPCYDFTPLTRHTFGAVLRKRLD